MKSTSDKRDVCYRPTENVEMTYQDWKFISTLPQSLMMILIANLQKKEKNSESIVLDHLLKSPTIWTSSLVYESSNEPLPPSPTKLTLSPVSELMKATTLITRFSHSRWKQRASSLCKLIPGATLSFLRALVRFLEEGTKTEKLVFVRLKYYPKGLFFIKSAYKVHIQLMRNAGSSTLGAASNSCLIWTKIWTVPCPIKVK